MEIRTAKAVMVKR